MRALIEKSTLALPILLPHDDPTAFEVLVSSMNPGLALGPCHQSGVHPEEKISVRDNQGIPLAFKLWVLAHCLGGAFLVPSDACM
jgi:hypothetical protein